MVMFSHFGIDFSSFSVQTHNFEQFGYFTHYLFYIDQWAFVFIEVGGLLQDNGITSDSFNDFLMVKAVIFWN